MSGRGLRWTGLLLEGRELAGTARQVEAALEVPGVDPEFRRRLHSQVVAERARLIRLRRHMPWWRRLWERARAGPSRSLAPALAVVLAVCVVLTGALVVPRLERQVPAAVAMTGAIQSSSPALVVGFSRPMDRASVGAALRIAPAASVHVGWRGDDLVLTPEHGFAPNVPYVLTLNGARARTAGGAALANSPRLSFGTAPAVSSEPGQGVAGRTAADFATAQLRDDGPSLRALTAPGLHLPVLPSLSRAWVVSVQAMPASASRVDVDLLVDAGPGHPRPLIAAETLVVRPLASGRLAIAAASVGAFQDLGDGPRIVHAGRGNVAGTVQVTYDCDMDPASIAGANRVTDSSGRTVPISTSYDPATRTVTVWLPASVHGAVQLSVTRGLRDVEGQNLSAPFRTTVQLGSGG